MEKRDLLHLMAFVWHRIEEDFFPLCLAKIHCQKQIISSLRKRALLKEKRMIIENKVKICRYLAEKYKEQFTLFCQESYLVQTMAKPNVLDNVSK